MLLLQIQHVSRKVETRTTSFAFLRLCVLDFSAKEKNVFSPFIQPKNSSNPYSRIDDTKKRETMLQDLVYCNSLQGDKG